MKQVVISCGPIPARLDSVKFITNRFKGGLAFMTAQQLAQNFGITVVKWQFTELPENFDKTIKIVNVRDVFEYFQWFSDNVMNYDAFIMAGAVANLTPSKPLEGKFPSHNYQVGEKFNIEFEIAPRAIDIIKQKNLRCCLIGYKLFDAKTDQELIDVAKITLKESKANVIFANTPKDAKSRKLVLTQDGAVFECDFGQHIQLIEKVIKQQYFKTEIVPMPDDIQIKAMGEMIKLFEKTFDGFGTVAIKTQSGMVTTSRGHRGGVVFVQNVDYEKQVIYSTEKATLNAPMIFKLLQQTDFDYVVHRHQQLENVYDYEYTFPGTADECKMVDVMLEKSVSEINVKNHGYVRLYKFKDVEWDKYYQQFPEKYFKEVQQITNLFKQFEHGETLEIGGNSTCQAKYLLDPNIIQSNSITYEDLSLRKFDLIVLKNSIAYLTEEQLQIAKNAVNSGGQLIANTFKQAPALKATENEVAFINNDKIQHYLKIDDLVYQHWFYSRDYTRYLELGFEVQEYGTSSILVTFKPK